jgi:hypothetical protein
LSDSKRLDDPRRRGVGGDGGDPRHKSQEGPPPPKPYDPRRKVFENNFVDDLQTQSQPDPRITMSHPRADMQPISQEA